MSELHGSKVYRDSPGHHISHLQSSSAPLLNSLRAPPNNLHTHLYIKQCSDPSSPSSPLPLWLSLQGSQVSATKTTVIEPSSENGKVWMSTLNTSETVPPTSLALPPLPPSSRPSLRSSPPVLPPSRLSKLPTPHPPSMPFLPAVRMFRTTSLSNAKANSPATRVLAAAPRSPLPLRSLLPLLSLLPSLTRFPLRSFTSRRLLHIINQ
jgi:hypothetical protein